MEKKNLEVIPSSRKEKIKRKKKCKKEEANERHVSRVMFQLYILCEIRQVI